MRRPRVKPWNLRRWHQFFFAQGGLWAPKLSYNFLLTNLVKIGRRKSDRRPNTKTRTMRFVKALRSFGNRGSQGHFLYRNTSSVRNDQTASDGNEGRGQVRRASFSTRNTQSGCPLPKEPWFPVFSSQEGASSAAGSTGWKETSRNLEFEGGPWQHIHHLYPGGIDSEPKQRADVGSAKGMAEPKTSSLAEVLPEDTRWDVFVGNLLTHEAKSAFVTMMSVFEQGRQQVLLDHPCKIQNQDSAIEAFDDNTTEGPVNTISPSTAVNLAVENSKSSFNSRELPSGSVDVQSSAMPLAGSPEDSGVNLTEFSCAQEQSVEDGPDDTGVPVIMSSLHQFSNKELNGNSNNGLLQSPFESMGMSLPHPAGKKEALSEYSSEASLSGSEECSVGAASVAFESPKLLYTTLPQLIYNIDVTIVEPSWERGGGFSCVRKGLYTDCIGRPHEVAVKHVRHREGSLAVKAREALENEWKILSQLPTHPNIVRMIGANLNAPMLEGHHVLLVEELMELDLSHVLHDPTANPLNYGQIVGICIDIACGLVHLENNGVVHFDLKPQNILLDGNLCAKIADFGSSKSKLRGGVDNNAGGGTIGYVAPEQLLPPLFADKHSSGCDVPKDKVDVYGLGVILFECITRRSLLELSGSMSAEVDISADSRSNGMSGLHVGDWCPDVLRKIICDSTDPDYHRRSSIHEVLSQLEGIQASAPWLDECPRRTK